MNAWTSNIWKDEDSADINAAELGNRLFCVLQKNQAPKLYLTIYVEWA